MKPDFFTDADIGALPPVARLAFIGLWTQADREGRLECDPRELGIRLLPYDNADMEAILARLAEPKLSGQPFIIRYTDNGHHYIQIVNFRKHQRPHPQEAPSVLPSPDGQLSDGNHVAAVGREGKTILNARGEGVASAGLERLGGAELVAEYGEAAVEEAIAIAKRRGKATRAYVAGILKKGVVGPVAETPRTIEDMRREEAEREAALR